MEEKIYKIMRGAGALNIVLGVISLVVGIAAGLKIVCGKRTTFLRIKNIPTGRSCRPSWGASVWCPWGS